MSQDPWEIRRYVTEQGICPFAEWLLSLDAETKRRIDVRISRVRSGNFGDHQSMGEGVYELRFFFGSGYRAYYAISERRVVLLLAGGDKKGQSKDIKEAKRLWRRYKAEQ